MWREKGLYWGSSGDVEFDDEKKDDKVSEDKVSEAVDISSLKISMVDRAESFFESQDPVVDSEDSNSTQVSAGDTPHTKAKRFEELNLSPELLNGLYLMGFGKPTKVQGISLPMILTPPYENLIVQAHNGSGKTTCFVLGMLSRVDSKIAAPQALCVCPTRELTMQNRQVLVKMAKHTGITSVCAVPTGTGNDGSTSRPTVVNDQVVIGTPGTLKRWISNKVLSTTCIKIIVFDDADHMLAQHGYEDDSRRIIKSIKKNPDHCQILLSAATYDENVKKFKNMVFSGTHCPRVAGSKKKRFIDVIKQYVVKCPNELAKVEVLKDRIFPLAEKLGQSIIFVRNRENASMLHSKLEAEGYKCTSIQGGLNLCDRDRVIKEFRTGVTKILISTDLLARGFQHAQVTLVVNFDLPIKHSDPLDPNYEIYLQRIGRNGHSGRKGVAFSLICTDQEEKTMNKIEEHFQRPIPEVPWNSEDDFEAALKEAGLA